MNTSGNRDAWVERISVPHVEPFRQKREREHIPLAGRESEIATLTAYFHTAATGHTLSIALTGDPGLGKTRLLDALSAVVVAEGGVVLRGEASDAEGMPPYLPFLDALGPSILSASESELEALGSPTLAILSSIFPELLTRCSVLPSNLSVPPAQQKLRLFEGISRFVGRMTSSQPVALILDDLHWADPTSLELLGYITHHYRNCRLLIVSAFQPGLAQSNPALERILDDLNRRRRLVAIPLPALDQDAIKALSEGNLGSTVAANVTETLYRQSEGNPFFAEELLRGWIESGALVHDAGEWKMLGSQDRRLPPGIVAALRQRFARTDPDIIGQLRVAAVIGRSFDSDLLARVQERDIEEVEEILLQACRTQLIHPYRAGTFRFAHDKIRECLYAEVSTARRRRLHEAIGRAQESRALEHDAQHLASLAFHFAHSGDRERGFAYSIQAADAADAVHAAGAVVRHVHTALQLLDEDDERRGDVLMRLGEAALQAGETETAHDALELAERWWLNVGERGNVARAMHARGIAQVRQERLHAAGDTFLAALAILDDGLTVDSPWITIPLLVDLGNLVGNDLGQDTQALPYAQRALDEATLINDPALTAAASRTLGNVLVRLNRIPEGIHLLEQGLSLSEASGDLAEEAACCAGLAQAYFWSGELARSREITLRRERIARHAGDPFLTRHVYTWLAYLHACRGEWTNAERMLAKAEAIVGSAQSSEAEGFLRQIRGFLAFQRGQLALAERELRAAIAIFREKYPGELALCLGPLVVVLMTADDHDDAAEAQRELEALDAATAPGTITSGTIRSCVAMMALRENDDAAFSRHADSLLPFQGQCHWFPIDGVLGTMAIRRGDVAAAEAHLTRAEAAARRERMLPQLARILVARAELERARNAPGDAYDAVHLRQEAAALFHLLELDGEERAMRSMLDTRKPQPQQARQPAAGGLSRRELEVIRLVATGKSNREIGADLCISEKTVANCMTSIFTKTGADNRAAAAAFALRHGLA